MTMAQKILARASGRDSVKIGDLVWVDVDLAMVHDSSGPRRIAGDMERLGTGLWDPDKVTVISDHFVAGNDVTESTIQKLTREWVARHGVKKFHEREGICHIVPGEYGYVRPGMLMMGGDSHSNTHGVFGAMAVAMGSTDMLGVLCTGRTWLKVPETVRINWHGKLGRGVMAKDMMLHTIGNMGGDVATYMAVEFGGEAVYALPFDERIVLPNMTTEMGAKAGMIEPDELIFVHLERLGVPRDSYQPVYADPDAPYVRVENFDAGALTPLVALPGKPDNLARVEDAAGTKIDQAYIGACTGAKYHDLAIAAQVLKGRRVAHGTRLMIAPASVKALKRATGDGTLEILLDAGATLLPSSCGACAGLGGGVLAPGERCISSTNRNFPGRMGDLSAEVYLGSPATVAASAIEGRIADPRPYLS
ncbi:MAG: 3-isopropylmalate dehydratase large subunit [Firmicutes bacterium]|nr:3-isopropylmalate dehydratase large subunit [Bacillota bacterium]